MPSSFTRRALAGLLLSVAGLGSAHAGAIDNITVGQAGLEGNCTVATIQAAINLAAANPGPDTIWVTRDTPDGYYLATSALTIDDPDVEIVGGFDNCFDDTPSGYTDISGNGNAEDPVFRIRGTSSVRLQNLLITLGDADGTEGAGIDFQGNGVLEVVDSVIEYNNTRGGNFGGGIRVSGAVDLAIANSRINNNSAQSGGGISYQGRGRVILNNAAVYDNAARDSGGGLFLQGVGGSVSAYFEQGVTISRNQAADDGGGVYAGTQVGLEWSGADAEMWQNSAGDLGGGIVATDGATLDLFPRGRLYPPTGQYHGVFNANSARHGGAIAAAAFQNRDVNVRLSSHDGQNPQVVAGNIASDLGAALYVKSWTDGNFLARACLGLADTTVVGNVANRGAGIYAQRGVAGSETYGNWVAISPGAAQSCGFTTPRPTCNTGKECSAFQDNQSAQGAVIDSEGGSTALLLIDRTRFTGNTGSHVVYLGRGGNARLSMNTSLLAVNTLSGGVVRNEQATFRFVNNTVAGNMISGPVLDTPVAADLVVLRNILAQPGSRTLLQTNGAPPAASIVDNLSNDAELSTFDPSNFVADPRFGLGFTLSPASPAVDRVVTSQTVDLAGFSRPFDRPDVPDHQPGTTTDLGAYELQAGLPDALFRNGFE